MILYENTYEREGNDSWLVDYVQLHLNSFGLYLEHKKLWSGWAGEDKGNHTLELDVEDLDKSQEKLDKYLEEHSLKDEITIILNELIKIMKKLLLIIILFALFSCEVQHKSDLRTYKVVEVLGKVSITHNDTIYRYKIMELKDSINQLYEIRNLKLKIGDKIETYRY